jgi:hypothetical protein
MEPAKKDDINGNQRRFNDEFEMFFHKSSCSLESALLGFQALKTKANFSFAKILHKFLRPLKRIEKRVSFCIIFVKKRINASPQFSQAYNE